MVSNALNKIREMDVTRFAFDPWPVVAGWVVTALVAAVIPWAHWNRKRQAYYKYAGYLVEYQNQQREQEEAQNGNQYQYYQKCSWWNFSCSRRNNNQYNNYNGQQQQQQQQQNYNNNQQYYGNGMRYPNWFWKLGGSTEEERRDREEFFGGDTTPMAVRLVHAWTNLLFAGLVIYGAVALVRGNNLNSVRTAFFIFLQFAVMVMILLPQGAITTEEREMEDSVYGWYGQLGVLMVYQDFWYAIFSVFALFFLTARMIYMQRQMKASTNTTSYKTMDGEGSEEGNMA